MTAQSSVTTTVKRTVFQSNVTLSVRQTRCHTFDVPAPAASVTRKISGSANAPTTTTLSASNVLGRGRRRGAVRFNRSFEGLESLRGGAGASVTRSSFVSREFGDRAAPSQELDLAKKAYRPLARSELRDVDGRGLKILQGRFGLGRRDARSDRVLKAD